MAIACPNCGAYALTDRLIHGDGEPILITDCLSCAYISVRQAPEGYEEKLWELPTMEVANERS